MDKKSMNQVGYYKQEILRLFLTIFFNNIIKNLKLRKIPRHESKYRLTQILGRYENYELTVLIGDKVYNRTMSIRLLAEGSGAKSTVFEVVYDIHIVVKIPSSKIIDFNHYLQKVMHEKAVIECLEDQIVTIVPEFQCILKKVFPIDEKVGLAHNRRIEKAYVYLLTKNQKLHRFLQLDGGYVFFMYLSRNRTLGDFIRQIYNETEMVEKEIRENEGIFWDAQSFQGRYEFHEHESKEEDGELDGLFAKYNEAFDFIDSYLKSVIRNEYKIKIETYQNRQWFISYLSNQQLNVDDAEYPEGFLQTLTIAFKYIVHNYSETFDKFFKVIKDYSEKKNYTYNKEKLRIICSNLLVVFTILFRQRVSHRDLKPDNIIVVANNFERSEMVKSGIGLIDFETAYAARLENNLEMTGGTPQYATLSQLYNSKVLAEVYGDSFRNIFNYQDLYALMAVIYQLFTGETLFMRTGSYFKRAFFEIVEDDALATGEGYIKLSKRFWAIASEELREKLDKEEKRLKSFQVRLRMDDMSRFLAVFFQPGWVKGKLGDLEQAVSCMLETQDIFNEDQIRIIQEADAERIVGLIKKNEKKELHDHISLLEKIRPLKEKISVFHTIDQLRQHIDSYQKFKEQMLNNDFDDEEREIFEIQLDKQRESIEERPGINIFGLIKVLFDITYDNLYRKEWGTALSESPMDMDQDESGDLEFQPTI